MSVRGSAVAAALSVSLLLPGCGAGSPAAQPVPSESGSIGTETGSFPGTEPIEATCTNLGTLLEAAGRPGEERWDVLAIRIYSLSLRAESDSDRTMLADLAEAARELNGGAGDPGAWTTAEATTGERCAAVGVRLP